MPSAAPAASRGPFHGVPIVFKDNIDATELPTTGGSLALLDHRPRLDSRVAAGMKQRRRRRARQGQPRRVSVRRLRHQHRRRHGRQCLRSVAEHAGSSGGSATAVAASLAALGFGTDTCNSLSNPSAFASLATIRTTRGLTSRAGVMPLNTYNDAVGPMAKSVRDVALALDLVTGQRSRGSGHGRCRRAHLRLVRRQASTAASLKGKRIGALRQRFVGFTGEREIAGSMDARDQGAAVAGRDRRRRRDCRLRREVRGRAGRARPDRCARAGPRICRAARSPATRCSPSRI